MSEWVDKLEKERDRQLQEARWELKSRMEGAFQRFIETLDAEIGSAADFDTTTIRAWIKPAMEEATSASIERWQTAEREKGRIIL